MHIRKYLQSLLWLALLITSTPSLAVTVGYIMGQSNALADDVDYLSVVINDDTDGQLDFWVETLPALSDIAGDNYGIQSFAFNFSDFMHPDGEGDDIDDLLAGSFILPDGWRVQYNKGMSEAGQFDVRIIGSGDTRQDPLHFSVIGLSLDDIFTDFAAHVAGFDLGLGDCNHDVYGDDGCGDGINSAFFYGNREFVVPVPAAVWLFGSGLLGLMGVARRRKI
jgi:hypothetical protein